LTKLITASRTAIDIGGTPDKEATSYNDMFDAFRLALNFYHFEDEMISVNILVNNSNRLSVLL
jgi:hypothetical protein